MVDALLSALQAIARAESGSEHYLHGQVARVLAQLMQRRAFDVEQRADAQVLLRHRGVPSQHTQQQRQRQQHSLCFEGFSCLRCSYSD